MTREEVREIAVAAADETVHQMLTALGVDASEPDAMLKMQADFRFVRRWREANEAVPRYALKAVVVTLATGFAGYLLILLGWKP